jgi:hypothetical protein
MFSLWIECYWVNEFSIVVFSIQSSLSGLSYNDELVNGLLVGEILVEIIFKVLDSIHFLLNKVISSNSLEWEGLVIELPCVNTLWTSLWVNALFL